MNANHVIDIAPLIRVSRLHYGYTGPDGLVPVLDDVCLSVHAGEFVSILGSSGSGKSSFLNLLGGMERPSGGEIWVAGRNLASLSPRELEGYRQTQVSFIFQFFNLLPTLTAHENVLLGLEAMDHPPRDAKNRARDVLASVGLETKFDRYPSQLSGGEQQRVAIARALAKRAPLILADEPTGNLDEDTAATVMDLFVRVQRESGTTVVLITHDQNIARHAGRMAKIVKGSLRETSFIERVAMKEPGRVVTQA